MLVVDTSAVLDALTGRPRNLELIDRLQQDGDLHAPHLIDIEMLYALRRLVGARKLRIDEAVDLRTDFADLVIIRYPHGLLADRIWELRDSLTAYDAAFVSLAEALGVPLITCDVHLSRASGHRARVELM